MIDEPVASPAITTVDIHLGSDGLLLLHAGTIDMTLGPARLGQVAYAIGDALFFALVLTDAERALLRTMVGYYRGRPASPEATGLLERLLVYLREP